MKIVKRYPTYLLITKPKVIENYVEQENNRLSGHHNSKQKIHQHMQLKKELMDQSLQIKQQRDQIMALTLERDGAVEMLKMKESSAPYEAANANENTALSNSTVGVKTRSANRVNLGTSSSENVVAPTVNVRTKDLVASYTRKYLDQQPQVLKRPLADRDSNSAVAGPAQDVVL
jgi:hypothetical protein